MFKEVHELLLVSQGSALTAAKVAPMLRFEYLSGRVTVFSGWPVQCPLPRSTEKEAYVLLSLMSEPILGDQNRLSS